MSWWKKMFGGTENGKRDLKGTLLTLLQEGGNLPAWVKEQPPEELTDVMGQIGWRLPEKREDWWNLVQELGLADWWEEKRKSSKAEERALVLDHLGKLDDEGLIPWFVEGLRDKSDPVGLAAVDALGKSNNRQVPDLLGQAFVKPEEGFLPDRVARAMILQGVKMLEVLRGLLDHRVEEVRAKALEVLSQMNPQEMGLHQLTLGVEMLPKVLDSLQDPSPLVREKAIEVTGRWRLEGATALILEALEDQTPKVRAKAAWAVGVLQYAQGRGILENLVNDGEWLVQEAARRALQQLEGAKIS